MLKKLTIKKFNSKIKIIKLLITEKQFFLKYITILIGVCENILENNYEISKILQQHQQNTSNLLEINKALNIKKKNFSNHKKHHRCILHSKKSIPTCK